MECRLCKAETIVFLDLGKQPLANKYPKKEEFENEEFFPLEVLFCPECKNVQLGKIISRARMFEDYYYLSSVNSRLVKHFEELAEELKNSKFVVDIGSNDGILLKPLKELGVKFIGVDPSVNVGKIANDAGLTTIVSFFDSDSVKKIKNDYGIPDIVVASSIFTHLENPHDFIKDLRDLMSENSTFILEVEYIGNILKNTQFERFYLDRPYYYSITSIKKLFEQYGMHVHDVMNIEPHGGSIRVIIGKTKVEPSERVSELLKKEEQELTSLKLKEFKNTVEDNIKAFREKLIEYKENNLKVAGYGSPARVSTICNYGKIGRELIKFTVDDSPLKQNKFTPGTHIPIVSREHLEEYNPDIIVMFAYEYFEDIKKKLNKKYRFLLPIPPKEIE